MLEAVWKHGVLFYAVGVMCVLGVISKPASFDEACPGKI